MKQVNGQEDTPLYTSEAEQIFREKAIVAKDRKRKLRDDRILYEKRIKLVKLPSPKIDDDLVGIDFRRIKTLSDLPTDIME